MLVEKNNNIYTVTELNDKWRVTADKGKVSVSFEVAKELCSTVAELREYIENNDLF